VAWIVSAGNWQNWVLSILADVNGGRVLELGFGPGHLQTALYQKGVIPIGIDASRQMSGLAFRNVVKCGFTPLLVSGYAQSLPFSNASFDHIVASFPTNYILDPLSLAEAYRVLKPGGKITILPLARPVGNSMALSLLRFLFRITGQAPGQANDKVLEELRSVYLDPFNQAGFVSSLSFHTDPSGEIWIIHAIKPVQEVDSNFSTSIQANFPF
jgi:ubiquinone/menaquinone biosynthesis C-methylase UbiE